MTILPGSLDHLYYNGILERIPYEAYEIIPAAPYGAAYNTGSMKGQIYGNYGNSYGAALSSANYYQAGDMPSAMPMCCGNYGGYISPYADLESVAYLNSASNIYNNVNAFATPSYNFSKRDIYPAVYNENNYKNSIYNEAKGVKEGVLNSHPTLKGLIAAAVIIATPLLLFRGRKKPSLPAPAPAPANTVKTGFWSKLNPKNWFRKKS